MMPRKSLKQWLVDANGWQRIWFVSSVVCLLYFVVMWPLTQANIGSSFRYEMRWATEREMKNPMCTPYMTQKFNELAEPKFSSDGSTCYHIYSHRKYSDDQKPITESIYQQNFDANERQTWLMYIGMGLFVSVFLSAFVYGLGKVTSWIIKGFKRSE